jgi:hypothetical protein
VFIRFIKDCCEGSCVHQGLLGLGLRHVDYLHVACWIRSYASGCILSVIGRILIGLNWCERSRQNSRIIGVILINVPMQSLGQSPGVTDLADARIA